MTLLRAIGRRKLMNKKMIKCRICDIVAEEEDCQLMTVIINKDGEEIKVCCAHLAGLEKQFNNI